MRPLRIAVVAGEESGDLLAADLVRALKSQSGRDIELVGVGGEHLAGLGLASLFDPHRISIMGISAVLRDLPGLVTLIGRTARAIVAAKPDCLITIDSPAFNLRVSKKVRSLDPKIPIVKYVCPSVWAWRPGRAPAMKAYVDHVLCILPFEPEVLARLGGPPGTYVGHRMTHDAGLVAAQQAQMARRKATTADARKTLLVLPGSRRAEVRGLAKPFGEVVRILAERGNDLRVVLPVVPRVAVDVRAAIAGWPVSPEIVEGHDGKWHAFSEADAALAASGTVLLELALAGVPAISCYKLDPVANALQGLITTWSAALPNIIADKAIIPEFYNVGVRPPMLSRYAEALLGPGPARDAQLQGFDEVRRLMAVERPSGEIAAGVVMKVVEGSRAVVQ